MAKDKQQVKFEADVTGFKTNIKEAEKSITNLNNQLKLNQAQLKGNEKDTNLLSQRIDTLKAKYDEQAKIADSNIGLIKTLTEEYNKQTSKVESLKLQYDEVCKSMRRELKRSGKTKKQIRNTNKQAKDIKRKHRKNK